MRWPVPTCQEPKEKGKLYLYLMYHEFFFGPFADDAAVVDALKKLDKEDPMWDYDCCAICIGDPEVKNYGDLQYITGERRKNIERLRKGEHD